MSVVSLFKKISLMVWTVETLSLRFRGDFFLIHKQNKFSVYHWQDFPSRSMATLRNKRKLAAVSRETPEGSRSSRAQNVLDPELTQDYISQVSEEIEGRVTKKISKEFSKTESRILGALSKLDEFLLNPQVRTCSMAVPGTSRNTNLENRETTGDRSSEDPYPELGYFSHHSGQLNSPETETNAHMVTGPTEEFLQHPHMMTATQEEISYCSPTTSSSKQKKARSASQPKFRSENTPATIEADQILLALQQLATNSNSANFNNNISQISKFPKSLTTTMPTFDGKSEEFELFEDLFQTSLKIHNQLTEEDNINYFHSLMRGDALQTFKNITSPNRKILGEILTVFHRKYVKPRSMATAKHKHQRLVFNPANQKLIDFLDELQKLAKDAFGVAAQAIIEQFIYVKMPPHLKKSINQAHLENGTYEQIVSHLERELELNGLEAPDEMPINTLRQQAPQQDSNKPKPTCHHCKKKQNQKKISMFITCSVLRAKNLWSLTEKLTAVLSKLHSACPQLPFGVSKTRTCSSWIYKSQSKEFTYCMNGFPSSHPYVITNQCVNIYSTDPSHVASKM